jgi:leucyl aminopeptidase (aminopeptidase T)
MLTSCQPAGTSNSVTTANNSIPANTQKETTPAKKAPLTNLQQLAQRIVTQSAGVKEGEIVMIGGSQRDAELLENLVIEVEKVGGHALLTGGSENITKRSFAEVPEKYDSAEPKLGLALAKIINVSINVDSTETDALLADVPPARLEARAKAGQPVGKEFRQNKVRAINIGNDLYPTEWRAKRFDMPLDNFAKLFWEGLNVDYSSLQAAGDKARAAMAGKEVEITHSNGTSLKANIESKPAYVSDGIITPEDVAKGDLDAFLPAGEAVVIPAANSGTGKFVIEKDYFNGKEMHNVVLNFENGKLTSMTGEGDGFNAMKADYDSRGPGKELLSFVDIGINPNYTLAPGSKLGNWISAGMVTLGSGNNMWAGGSIAATGGVSGHLAGCTVKIDGKTIVENGVLKL